MARHAALARQLIDRYQRDIPLVPQPFAQMAREVGSTEGEVLRTLAGLEADGTLSRIGAVVPPGTMGASTLAAMAVPEEDLDAVAAMVSAFPEVNHNYGREHALNLWFVAMAADRERLNAVLAEIERRTGLEVIDVPLERAYRIDLGFEVSWS